MGAVPATPLSDALGRAWLTPVDAPDVPLCVATVAAPGEHEALDALLASLRANGRLDGALLAVLAVDPDAHVETVAAAHGAILVVGRSIGARTRGCHAVLYSVARFVRAARFVCLDTDMLVVGDLRPVVAALDACAPRSVFGCRDAAGQHLDDLEHALVRVHQGPPGDLKRIGAEGRGGHSLLLDDGLFAGRRSALLALDTTIRKLHYVRVWIDERPDVWWRHRLVFNVALARLQSGVELDAAFNVQLRTQTVDLRPDGQPAWHGRSVRALRFDGAGATHFPALRTAYAAPDLRRVTAS